MIIINQEGKEIKLSNIYSVVLNPTVLNVDDTKYNYIEITIINKNLPTHYIVGKYIDTKKAEETLCQIIDAYRDNLPIFVMPTE